MDAYLSTNSFGHYQRTRVWEDCQGSDPVSLRAVLDAHFETTMRNTFSRAMISDSILSSWQLGKSDLNTLTIENSLRLLQSHLGFEFPRPGEVVDYLLKHQGLYDLVLYTCYRTEEIFGHNSQISLELYHDPEIHDEYLTIFVRQEEYEPDIIDQIDAICREYEQELAGIDGYLLVNTDFQPPTV